MLTRRAKTYSSSGSVV